MVKALRGIFSLMYIINPLHIYFYQAETFYERLFWTDY